jgi:hypothetical protein
MSLKQNDEYYEMKFELEQQDAEELYRKNMVAEVKKRLKSEIALYEDADLDEIIAFCEVELRERHDARERAVQEYADSLPF